MSGTQSLLTWSDEFSIGMPEIDAQHGVLIELINQVWNTIIPAKPDHEKTFQIIEELERYTLTHFTAEEVFLREMGYLNFDQHKAKHDHFVARIAQEKAKISSGQRMTLDIVYFLRDWLINHILVSDKEYVAEFKNRALPVSSSSPTSSSTLGKFFKRFWG
jgi:hemerythrin-like metal-binding protein